MRKVIPFKVIDEGPSVSGEAKCAACGYEYVAAVPAKDAWDMVCPKCYCAKAYFRYPAEPKSGSLWTCSCGCDVFRVCANEHGIYQGILCINCGQWQSFS